MCASYRTRFDPAMYDGLVAFSWNIYFKVQVDAHRFAVIFSVESKVKTSASRAMQWFKSRVFVKLRFVHEKKQHTQRDTQVRFVFDGADVRANGRLF